MSVKEAEITNKAKVLIGFLLDERLTGALLSAQFFLRYLSSRSEFQDAALDGSRAHELHQECLRLCSALHIPGVTKSSRNEFLTMMDAHFCDAKINLREGERSTANREHIKMAEAHWSIRSNATRGGTSIFGMMRHNGLPPQGRINSPATPQKAQQLARMRQAA